MYMKLEDKILEFVKKQKATYFSDIARAVEISNYAAADVARLLEKEGKVIIRDKGIAKLVMPAERCDWNEKNQKR